MANPPKKKGTGGERDVLQLARARGLDAKRTPAGARYDIEIRGNTGRTIQALATRPDRGRWLVTIPLEDFIHVLSEHGDNAHIEVKRYARFQHHRIYDDKFPEDRMGKEVR